MPSIKFNIKVVWNLILKTIKNYNENYKTILEKKYRRPNKWKNNPCSWIRGVTPFKMAILPKWPTDSLQSLSTSQMALWQKWTTYSRNSYENARDPEYPKSYWKRTKLVVSHRSISKVTTKLIWCGTDIGSIYLELCFPI